MNKEYYKINSEEVINIFNSKKEGLTNEEANNRLEKNGLNKLKDAKKKSLFVRFIDQFKNVMIIVLIISAILSALVSSKTGEPMTDTIIILVVVFLNALLGVLQESKAEKAIEALKKMSAPSIKVKRQNNVVSIKTEEIVIGDIVLLEAGDYVPADMRIIDNHSLRVEESALTGESVPIDKQSDIINSEKNLAIADRLNMLYAGSSVVYGRAEAVVVAIGMDTELGKIASAISTQDVEVTPLQKKMDELSKYLSIIVIFIAILMFVIGYIQGNKILDIFMLAISLAVAAIPEGLVAVITITLAIGVQKMAKQKAIVRKLSSVEALGSTEVICSDKTGTLTQNKMTVRKLYIDEKLIDVTGNNINDLLKDEGLMANLNLFLNCSILCNDTKISMDNGEKILLGDPTETALVSFSEKLKLSKEILDNKFKRSWEIPFDSERKMMTTVNESNSKFYAYTKGAVESVLEVCKYININGQKVELTDVIKQQILENNLDMARSALRVLAFAYKEDNYLENIKVNAESDLIFLGLIGMIDPPRPEAKLAVKECFRAGMIPVMITGDNLDTATAIAKELGILENEAQAILGSDVDLLTDEELIQKVNDIRVYARVSPENKIRIVKAWKSNNKIVAMTGDGVNDAPALKGADIGVGMGITGTEVSKSVSSMVLEDDNFATIVVAIKEGRRIYQNIKNVIAYLLASNLAEVIIIFIATLFNQQLLLPIQILWINLVTDTIPAIALGFEKAPKDIMDNKPRNSNENFFNPFLISRIIIPAIIKAMVIFGIYIFAKSSYGINVAITSVFLTLSIIEVLFACVCRSEKESILKLGICSNIPMLVCVVATLLLQVILIINPVFSSWLKIESMPMNMYISIMLISIITIMVLELVKAVLAKKFLSNKDA